MDYAVHVTQKENPHLAFDIGVGHMAGVIGDTAVPTGVANPPFVLVPIDLKANTVVGTGLSIRYRPQASN